VTIPNADPAWLAARTGLPGDQGAIAYSSQVAQFLASHGSTPVWSGAAITSPRPDPGAGVADWVSLLASDVDQPFTMSGTAIGHVTVPVSPVGNGADVTVSLWTDSAGSPGSLIASTVIPAAWLSQLAAATGLPAGDLATGQVNGLLAWTQTFTTWPAPLITGGASFWSTVQSGNFIILAGGNNLSNQTVATVYTVEWAGGFDVGPVLPQPPLPAATSLGAVVATADTLLYAGGTTASLTVMSPVATVYTAGWSPAEGVGQAWSGQAILPVAVLSPASAYDPGSGTVYVIGGVSATVSGVPSAMTTAVQQAVVTNGQVTAWTQGPPLPVARANAAAAVLNGWLVVVGGEDVGINWHSDTWVAKVAADGTLGSWQPGPPCPVTVSGLQGGLVVTTSAMVVGSYGGSGPLNVSAILAVTSDGPGQWTTITGGPSPGAGLFDLGDGTWQAAELSNAGGVLWQLFYPVPLIPVPLAVSGLTNGTVYHLVIHQDGGDAADYAQVLAAPPSLPLGAKTRPSTGGSWTSIGSSYAVPATVWDQTPSRPLLGLWGDSGQRVVSLLPAGAGRQLLGVLESTAMPSGPLNPNTLTTASGAGWTALNGTFSVSGSPPAGAPNPDAGIYTQVGSIAGAMRETGGTFPVTPGTWYKVSASVWTATTTCILGIDWLDNTGTLISTSTLSGTVPASTWTPVTATPLAAPAGAVTAYPRAAPASGNGNSIYATSVIAARVSAPRLPAVTAVEYNAAGLPSGTTQLA
jgi:hypothetical protein